MDWALFFTVLAYLESGNDPTAVGDKHLRHPAYGIYQMRQPALDDVNAIVGSELSMQDVVRSNVIAEQVAFVYIVHYLRRHKLVESYENAARIWNGGPRGWKKKSTEDYWVRFKAELDKRSADL